MTLQALVCTHATSQLAVRERLAFTSPDVLKEAYRQLQQRFAQTEFVILSTCNRVEIYSASAVDQPVPTLTHLAQFLAEFHSVPLDEFVGELQNLDELDVIRHLFQVVASLDSMVLGEPQIVTQVKEAYRIAEQERSCGPSTHALFQAAIHASARVRTETRLAEGRVSIASVAIGEFGKSIFEHFHDKQILVIGAGEMAEETLRYLKDDGATRIRVVNRSGDRAARLAATWGGDTAAWDDLDRELERADVVISTTGADQPIVTATRFKSLMKKRPRNRPVFILDLGAPRDFEHSIADLDDVFLYDIDSLRKHCERNRKARAQEIQSAERILDEETTRFTSEMYRRSSGSLVTQLREDWHAVSRSELERLFQKLPDLGEEERKAVEQTVGRIVNKLLHPPLEALRDESKTGTPTGLIDAFRRIFRLPD